MHKGKKMVVDTIGWSLTRAINAAGSTVQVVRKKPGEYAQKCAVMIGCPACEVEERPEGNTSTKGNEGEIGTGSGQLAA